jgi:hypothetical protein
MEDDNLQWRMPGKRNGEQVLLHFVDKEIGETAVNEGDQSVKSHGS